MTTLFICLLPALVATGPDDVSARHAQDPARLEWRARVTAAKALEDETQKRDALLALVREALSGRDVRLSGTSNVKHVDPADNAPAPVVNFDVRLNRKMSASLRSGAESRSLQGNFGYYFSKDGKAYVVLGPAALDPRSAAFTRLAADHELFHAEHHVGETRPIHDRELETWSHMFTRYFHDLSEFKQRWAPMLGYYEEADAAERRRALDRLVAYYRSATNDSIRVSMREWLAARRRDSAASWLVRDLEAALTAPPLEPK